MRLLDCGQCELDGEQLLFVVMEYAEESLSQILPYRALGPDEVQELLVPTLDALAFLHSEKWIQGQLKPIELPGRERSAQTGSRYRSPGGCIAGCTAPPFYL